jgi:hypothetical protein
VSEAGKELQTSFVNAKEFFGDIFCQSIEMPMHKREKREKILEHLLTWNQKYSVIRDKKRKKRDDIFCRKE